MSEYEHARTEAEDDAASASDRDAGHNSSEDTQVDEKNQQEVGFWDPTLKTTRKKSLAHWAITTFTLMVFILCVLSLYWAAFFHLPENLKYLTVYVVDFDGQAPFNTNGQEPIVGPAIVELARKLRADDSPPTGTLGYLIEPASRFDNDPFKVRQAIYDFDAWAAIIINANATALLYSAIQNGNASYDPKGACQMIFQNARDSTTYEGYIMPALESLMAEATATVGQTWAQQVFANISDDAIQSGIQAAPQAVSPAIGFSIFNLRAFYPFAATPAVSIGLIYLIILSFFSFSFYLPIHIKFLKPEGHPPLRFGQLIIYRWLANVSAYFLLSLAYSLVSLALQINFSGYGADTSDVIPTLTTRRPNPDAYGASTFLVYWMLNFFGMIALGLASENMAMFIGAPWMGLWLIFWVITNVVTGFYAIPVEPAFYQWGYAWPLHNIVEGSRQVLFDLHSRIGLNFGVLIAWGAVNTAVFPVACHVMRWKTKKGIHEYWS